MKPLIGISAGTFTDRSWCPPSFGHRRTYVDAIVRAGGAPVLVPPLEDETTLRLIYDRLDGVLLAAGGDIDPAHYGHPRHEKSGLIDPLRDNAELPVARWAIAEGKPVLGICRGMQIINVALGGTLYQDIPSQVTTELHHNLSFERENWTHMAHAMQIAPDSELAELLGVAEMEINSLHHQALDQLAAGLRPVAWSPDGIIEAIEGTGDPFLIGIQCHPEVLQSQADQRWQAVFAAFVVRCAKYRERPELTI